jgi:hypothetical protein
MCTLLFDHSTPSRALVVHACTAAQCQRRPPRAPGRGGTRVARAYTVRRPGSARLAPVRLAPWCRFYGGRCTPWCILVPAPWCRFYAAVSSSQADGAYTAPGSKAYTVRRPRPFRAFRAAMAPPPRRRGRRCGQRCSFRRRRTWAPPSRRGRLRRGDGLTDPPRCGMARPAAAIRNDCTAALKGGRSRWPGPRRIRLAGPRSAPCDPVGTFCLSECWDDCH